MSRDFKVVVHVENIAKYLPACRRCRKRSDEMLRDMYQPLICTKCQAVIREEFPHMVPLDPVDFEKARNCLWNHERECGCWYEGLKFPEPPEPFVLE